MESRILTRRRWSMWTSLALLLLFHGEEVRFIEKVNFTANTYCAVPLLCVSVYPWRWMVLLLYSDDCTNNPQENLLHHIFKHPLCRINDSLADVFLEALQTRVVAAYVAGFVRPAELGSINHGHENPSFTVSMCG